MTSVDIPSLRSLSVSMFMTCLKGTNINTFLLDSSITSLNTLYRCLISNSNASPLSVYTAPADICSNLFMLTAAFAADICSPAACITILLFSSL